MSIGVYFSTSIHTGHKRPFILIPLFCNKTLVDSSTACEDILTPAVVAESSMKVLKSCLAAMPAGE